MIYEKNGIYSLFEASNSGINVPKMTFQNVLYFKMEFHILDITSYTKYKKILKKKRNFPNFRKMTLIFPHFIFC